MGKAAGGGLVVFVGDGLSDLAALVAADVGIILRDEDGQVSPALQRAIEGLGLCDHQLRLREDLLESTTGPLGIIAEKMEFGPVLAVADDMDAAGELLLGDECGECMF